MLRGRDSSVFVLTLMSAAAVLVSIAAAEMLLAIACVTWIIQRPTAVVWPSYIVPICAFMLTTTIALVLSPQPEVGMSAVRKFALFTMGLLAANMVTTIPRARISFGLLLVVGTATSVYAVVQFVIAYFHFLSTQNLADDPTVLARITGFMGHWITFSGEQLLVWCAGIPAVLMLGRRWMISLGIVGTALLLSFTRSVWLGAAGGFIVLALLMPRKVLISAALPIAILAAGVSGLIYHRLSISFKEKQFGPDKGRFELFIAGISMIKDHPLFGVGPERIHTEFPHYYRSADVANANFYYGHLENNFLQLAAERGLLCMATFMWFIFELYSSLLARLKTATDNIRCVVLSALSALTGFMIAGLFTYNFGDSEVLLLLLFIVSLPYGITRTLPVEEPCPANLATIAN